MKTLKNYFAAFGLITILTFGTTLANAGIIVAGISSSGGSKDAPCTEPTDDFSAGLRGIIVAGLTGIIVAGAIDNKEVCGIIVAG